MFDFETALREWKTAAARRLRASELEELEDHLREEVSRSVENGHSPADVWNSAVEMLGNPAEISHEFAKVNLLPTADRIMLRLIVAIGILTIYGIVQGIAPLAANDFTLGLGRAMLVVGWLTGLLAAVIAAYGTLRSAFALTPLPSLTHATLRFIRTTSVIAATFMVLGIGVIALRDVAGGGLLLLGWEWWVRHQIHLLIGTPVVSISLIVAAVTASSSRIAPHIPLTMAAIAGGLILLTWFGPAVFLAPHLNGLYALIAFGGGTFCLLIAALSFRVRDGSSLAS